VTAEVDGTSVWFESADLPLRASAECFASAFLVPALARGARLVSQAPLDPEWLAGAARLADVFHGWWKYPRLVPVGAPVEPPPPHAPEADSRARGLFFSAGVDSFHALLRCGETVDLLVFVHGFDVPVADEARAGACLASVREVAATAGLRAGAVRTDVREHQLMGAAPWERTHGGAMAAVAHALGDAVHEMLIASSVPAGDGEPWGSHWKTDPHFSSSRVRLRQVGQGLRRRDKLAALAGESLPGPHLHVCWENRTASGNCSRCGKCVITRLVLAESGALERFPALAGPATLAADLDALRSDHRLQTLDEMGRSPRLDPEVRAAARRLFERSRHVRSLPVRLRRALVARLRGWLRRG
jgi:hypothetical protein